MREYVPVEITSDFPSGNGKNFQELSPNRWTMELEENVMHGPWYFIKLKETAGKKARCAVGRHSLENFVKTHILSQDIRWKLSMEAKSSRHIPVGVFFHPNWWHKNYGIDFGEKYYLDPEYRIQINVEMEKLLYERFGELGLGRKDPIPTPSIDFGVVAIPALFGCQVEFFANNSPWAQPLNLGDREVEKLEIPDIIHTWPMSEIVRQMDYLNKMYGSSLGLENTPLSGMATDFGCGPRNIDYQGLLNISYKIRGDQIFYDFYDNPQLVDRLLQVTCETMILVESYIRNRNKEKGLFVTSNCMDTMISDLIYQNFILKYENSLARTFPVFGIHNCGDATHILEAYSKVTNLRFLELGWGTDLPKARTYFPHIHINARLSPVRILNCSPAEVKRDVWKLLEGGGPQHLLSISCRGIEYGTPDDNIVAIFEAIEGFEYRIQEEKR